MERKEDGTMEHALSESEELSPVQQVIKDINEKYALQDEVSLYNILQEEYPVWKEEQAKKYDGKLLDNDFNKVDFINNRRKKFKDILEKILYEGVVDVLKTPNEDKIMLPMEAKESVLFLVGLGDAGKKYQKELKQLIKGKAIPSNALKYISEKIQLIFLKKDGMVWEVQSYINIRGLCQTQEMFSNLKKFHRIVAMAAAITDISAYNKIIKAMNRCCRIMDDVLIDWCYDDKELQNYDSWIRQKLRQEIDDKNEYSFKHWKVETFLDALDDIDE